MLGGMVGLVLSFEEPLCCSPVAALVHTLPTEHNGFPFSTSMLTWWGGTLGGESASHCGIYVHFVFSLYTHF